MSSALARPFTVGFFRCIVLTFALAACADVATAPVVSTGKVVPGVVRDQSWVSGSQVVVYSASGHPLVLDVPSQELRMDDGRVYLMDAEQTAKILSDFESTVSFDQLATEVETLPDPPPCGDGSGCWEPTNRVAPVGPLVRPVPTDKPQRTSGRRPARFHPEPEDAANLPTGSFSSSRRAAPTGLRVGAISRGRRFDYIVENPDCRSMKSDIITAMAAYRNERETVNQRWLDNGLSGFVYEAGRWVMHMTSSEVNAFVANIEADMVNKQESETRLDVMRVIYTSNGCGTITWAGQSSGGGGGGGGGGGSGMGGYGMTCNVETWQVSFDGGNTWRNIDVDVCQYATQ